MASSYPSSTKSFSTKLAGDTIAASHPNEIQDEVVAIENALRTGLEHDLLFTDNTYDIGKNGATRPRDLWLSRNARINGGLTVDGAGSFANSVDVTGALAMASASSSVKVGASSETARLGGVINTDSTQAATGANTTDTTLFTYTLPANALDADGRVIKFTAWGSFAANGNTKTVRLKFNGAAGSSIMAFSGTPNNQNWVLQGTVIRTGSNAQDFFGTSVLGPTAATNATFGTATVTDNAAIDLAVTAQNGSSSANDIVYEGSLIEFLN